LHVVVLLRRVARRHLDFDRALEARSEILFPLIMRDVPPAITIKSGHGATFVCVGTAAVGLAAIFLYFFNPAASGFYPRCFFKMFTGLDCPGCGGLRATHQLLHGNFREAFALNPLFVLALPLIGYFAARPFVVSLTGRRLPQFFKSSVWIWIGAAVVIAFGVLRNLPWRAWFGN